MSPLLWLWNCSLDDNFGSYSERCSHANDLTTRELLSANPFFSFLPSSTSSSPIFFSSFLLSFSSPASVFLALYVFWCTFSSFSYFNSIRVLCFFPSSFWRFRKLRKETIRPATSVRSSVRLPLSPSICPHGTSRLQQAGFSWNFIFEDLSNTCPENSSLVNIWQE
jgi:hypothetical protein